MALSLATHSLLPLVLSLCLGVSANPLPAPTPPPISADGSSASVKAAKDCTTYVTSLDYGFTGNWEPTMKATVYTSTAVAYTHVPCGGCVLATTVTRAPFWGGIGPMVRIDGTVTAQTPFSTISTVCLPENGDKPKMAIPGPAKPPGAGEKKKRQIPTTYTPTPTSSPPHPHPTTPLMPSSSARGSDCTTTRLSAIQMTVGPVKTVWTATATGTSHVDCGGCRFVAISTLNGLHPGPVVSFNSTVTATVPSAAVTYACLKSPSIVATPEPGWPSGTNTLPIERTKRAVEVALETAA